MPDGKDRSPALGFVLGIALAAGALLASWQAFLQVERVRRIAGSTFHFDRWEWIVVQAFLVLAGVLFGLIIILAFRGPTRSRRVTLLGGAVPPALLICVFWLLLKGMVHNWVNLPLRLSMFTLDQGTQAVAAVALGILLVLAFVPATPHDGR